MKKILITHAVREEHTPVSVEGYAVSYLFTEIGKAKSAMKLTQAILREQPDLVMNIGTSGTLHHQVGDIFVCREFVDRDFQPLELPGINYRIDSSALSHPLIEQLSQNSTAGVCNTGDTFVTEIASFEGDVVDMESFAQALVCEELQVPFVSVKYVTDIIGQNSVQLWEEKLADARKELKEWFAQTI